MSPTHVHHASTQPPIPIPQGHRGPVVLPGTNRQVWWTGRVAIGLRYEARQATGPLAESASWLQSVLLDSAPPRTRN